MSYPKTIQTPTTNTRPDDRNPILSLATLSEQHYDLSHFKTNDLCADMNRTRTEHEDETEIADRISTYLDRLEEIRLHLETSRTLLLTKTITNCPHCGRDIRHQNHNDY